MPETLIALDAGTTGVTCLLTDTDLRPIARAYREFEQRFPEPGRVEHDSREILDAVDATLEEILALPEADNVLAIGVTNQRETVFALDPGAGEAIVPGIVWQDRRTAQRCGELRAAGHSELIRERTGLLLDPYFSATKIEWMLREQEHLLERAEGGGVVFTTVDGLIVQHLTEQDVIAVDPTNASRTMLYDIERGSWDAELCALFGIRLEWLPEVRPSVGDWGITSPYLVGREIPIRGVAGDQQAALFGQGGFEPGSFKSTFGTGCFLMLNTGQERRRSEAGFLSTLALDAKGERAFALEGSLFMGGATVQWLRDGLGLIEDAAETEALARSVEDSGGVHLVPAFAGLGAPYWDPEARGALLGLTRGTNRAHVARAALESIALSSAELIDLLREESGIPIEEALVDGGATRNGLLLELLADSAGLTVRRPSDVEATARGAAMLAGIGCGKFDSGRDVPPLDLSDTRAGLPSEERAARLEAWRKAVARTLSESRG